MLYPAQQARLAEALVRENRGTRQRAFVRNSAYCQKMGNPAKSADVSPCRDTEKIKIKPSELTFMKKTTQKTIATFDTPIRNLMSPATAGFLIPLVLVCFGFATTAQAVGPDTDGTIPGSNNGEGIGV